jgi:hypothetical protein
MNKYQLRNTGNMKKQCNMTPKSSTKPQKHTLRIAKREKIQIKKSTNMIIRIIKEMKEDVYKEITEFKEDTNKHLNKIKKKV